MPAIAIIILVSSLFLIIIIIIVIMLMFFGATLMPMTYFHQVESQIKPSPVLLE